ncbi:hypothetical protein BDD41_2083 [Paracoccus versutus]|uniref:Uncharacterized protein n=2 Tax=Paracoccus versutus TaxID=34007 RepID=A0A3D9XV46_PARVE|nr:hypothetical protein BDD41_2083 [Paracoccus versutus]
MPVPDYDDPALFAECVSAITLKGEPCGYLADCLSEYEVEVTVAPAPGRGSSRAEPWLLLSDLEERCWAGRIKAAHLASDALQDAAGLYHLSKIEDLTISIGGRNFSENDVDTFQNAIGDLQGLRKLRLIVAENAIEEAEDCFRWPFAGFSVDIQVDKPARRGKKLTINPDPQA